MLVNLKNTFEFFTQIKIFRKWRYIEGKTGLKLKP